MRAPVFAFVLGLAACAPAEEGSEGLDGTLGFDLLGGLAMVCPPDAQGQFIKVFVEGPGPTSACIDQGGRPMPLTCEARRAYLETSPDVCLGAVTAPGENLPMLDLLLEEQADGSWTSFDVATLTHCVDGEPETLDLVGAVDVSDAQGEPTLSVDVATQGSGVDTLSGQLVLEVCPL